MQVPFVKDGQFIGSVEVDPGAKCKHINSESTGDISAAAWATLITCSSGCCDEYQCKDCGKKFMVECPD